MKRVWLFCRYDWSNGDEKAIILVRMLNCVATFALSTYPYAIESIESNSTLYGGSSDFLSAVDRLASSLINDLISIANSLSDDPKRQSQVAQMMLDCLLSRGDISAPAMINLARNLLTLMRNCKQLSNRVLDHYSNAINLWYLTLFHIFS